MLKKFLSLVLSIVLIASAVFTLVACDDPDDTTGAPSIEEDENNSDNEYDSDNSSAID